MTIQEFSDQFDILVNTYVIEYPIGKHDTLSFDEYEKSLFLSKAQEEFVISCYDGKNQYGYLFEHTEEDRRMLDSLIRTKELSPMQYSTHNKVIPISDNSYFYTLPNDLLFITYENCRFTDKENECIDNRKVIVVPTT